MLKTICKGLAVVAGLAIASVIVSRILGKNTCSDCDKCDCDDD